MLNSALGISGVFLTIIGLISLLIGFILFVVYKNSEWYYWFLIGMGIVLFVFGMLMIFFAVATEPTEAEIFYTERNNYGTNSDMPVMIQGGNYIFR